MQHDQHIARPQLALGLFLAVPIPWLEGPEMGGRGNKKTAGQAPQVSSGPFSSAAGTYEHTVLWLL